MQFLSDFNKLFTPVLVDYFERKKKEVVNLSSTVKETVERIESLTLSGGKRIRPALLYYSFLAFSKIKHTGSVRMHSPGVEGIKRIKNYCLALELLHSWALIHDDIMDRSILRRGAPTVNAYYKEKYKDPSFANSLSILAGDMALSFADELFTSSFQSLSHSGKPRHKRGASRITGGFWASQNDTSKLNADQIKLLHLYDQLKTQVIYGQIMDIIKVKTEKEVLKMIEYKTAGYSIEKPLLIGACLAGADYSKLKNLSNIAIKIGIAFQIQDDILGVFGDEKTLGKPVENDMKEGKMTLLVIKTLSILSSKDKKLFRALWGNPKSGKEELETIKKMIKDSGGLSSCLRWRCRLILPGPGA